MLVRGIPVRTDDAHQALAMVERFRAAGLPLVLVDEGKPELRSTGFTVRAARRPY